MSIRQSLSVIPMLLTCAFIPLGIVASTSAQETPANPWTVYYLKNTSAPEVSQTIDQLFASNAEKNTLRIVPDARTNALFVTGSKEELKLVEQLLKQLDGDIRRKTEPEHEIKIFTLQSGNAESMSKIVADLIDKDVEIVSDIRTNSLIATGSEEDLQVLEEILLRLDQSASHAQVARIYQLKNTPADTISKTLNDLQVEARIAVDTNKNQLLVLSNDVVHRQIEQMIKMLDASKEQPLNRQLLVRLVWLVDAKLLGENASDPAESLARTLEIIQGKLEVKNLKTASQMIVSIDPDGKSSLFDTTGTAEFADGALANLRVSGIIHGQKANSSVIELEINATSESLRNRSDPRAPGLPQRVDELVSMKTKVVAPDGHSIVLGVSSIRSAPSVFVLQVLPAVENKE